MKLKNGLIKIFDRTSVACYFVVID